MSHEFYKRYRPKKLSQLVGQESAVAAIQGWANGTGLPHAVLLQGPSGCGKTTIARILRKMANCSPGDFKEINCADFRGIDTVRDIAQKINLAPMGGSARIWLIDECHQLTKDAQNALLKLLEDTPDHAYFFLATTEPGKLLNTIQTRMSVVTVRALKEKELQELIEGVCEKEGVELDEEVALAIIKNANGSPRQALVLLGTVVGVKDSERQIQLIERYDDKKPAIMLARALMEAKPVWSKVAAVLKDVKDEDPEGLRRLVLGYCRTVMLGNTKLAGRCFTIINEFARNFFDSGHAGLTAACYAVVVDPE